MDKEIFDLIHHEEQRQKEQIRLIPSENYVSNDVLKAVGSVLMNKYSEGQAFKRYYQGNENIDQIETIVKSRALELFGLDPDIWGANVQAVTGSIANLAVYNTLLEPKDKILSMFLYDGGHLSHGWQLPENGKKISFTSHIYKPSYYYVDTDSRTFNYDEVAQRAAEENPRIIISGGTAYPREIDHAKMREIADSVQAYYMADIAHEAGLVAAGVNTPPFAHADVVTMTTRKTLRGPIGSIIFARKDIIEEIDRSVFPGLQGGPQNHSIAGIGVALHEAMQPDFKNYANQVVSNAISLADELMKHGFDVCTGGTDKHLVLIDLRNMELTGKQLAEALERANIITNKNTVPGDTAKPWNPSGLRIGSPAVTSRGMKEKEMIQIASWINEVAQDIENEETIQSVSKQAKQLALKFPAPGITT